MILNLFKKEIQFYKSIHDLPLENWFDIQRTNELSHLLKVKVYLNKEQNETLEKQWKIIYSQYINMFGISERMRRVLELKRDIAVLTSEMYLNNDRSRETFIDIKTLQLKQILDEDSGEKFDSTKFFVDKYMGFRIDPKTVTVFEYYGYIKFIESDIETKKRTSNVGE